MSTDYPAMHRTVVPSAVLPAPRFRYSPVVQAGPFVFVSGLVGLDPASGTLVEGGAYEQTTQVLGNLKALCREQNWQLEDLLVARVFCATAGDAAAVNKAWEEAFSDIEPPARTFVVVSALPLGAAVEIEFQLLLGARLD
ncbi:RidA family protein [Paraburkholderia sp. JHI869]|uniref:RidA family protein n=1 Tax=Paraburkholderia sp. JHI869 TaxID=3112959 RepID=UPI00319E0429